MKVYLARDKNSNWIKVYFADNSMAKPELNEEGCFCYACVALVHTAEYFKEHYGISLRAGKCKEAELVIKLKKR